MAFHSVAGLLEASQDLPLWQAVQTEDCKDSGESAQISGIK